MNSITKREKKYKAVTTYIQDYIVKHNLKEGDKLPTEQDLSSQYNVSRITIQRALKELQDNSVVYRVQGSGTYVGTNKVPSSPDTGISFIPIIARQDNLNNSFIKVIQGAESYLSKHSYYVTVHSPISPQNEREVIQSLINKKVPCLMVLPSDVEKNASFYLELIKKKIPIVFIDILPFNFSGNLVTSDNTYGGYLATKHLIQQGYRKIAFISYIENPEPSINDRINGYKYALQEYGIPFNPEYLCLEKSSIDIEKSGIELAINRIMSLPEPPDAIFCVNDIIAVGVYGILQRNQVNIPQDIALIGFDDLAIAAKQPVPISTIHQDFFKMGYSAAEMALHLIKEKPQNYTQYILPVSLVPRESTSKKQL